MPLATAPNLITLARLLLAPIMALFAWWQAPALFLGCFAAALLSDFTDGLLARARHSESRLGARLDTWGDAATGIAALLGAWLLWPEVIRREAVLIVPGFLALTGSALLGLIKHGRLPAYHTWGAKLSTALIGVTGFVMLLGLTPWPFRIAVLVAIASAVEEAAITTILPEWRTDVRSLRAALAIRRER